MKCLWLTWIDPWPEHDGQRIYSGRLVDAFAAAGAEVTVLSTAHHASHRRDGHVEGNIRWALVPAERYLPWLSVFSSLPHIAHRPATPAMRDRLNLLLARETWDCIIFDGLHSGWALSHCLAHYADGQRPRLIYISHNHEQSTRTTVARNYAGNPAKKPIILYDAEKAGQLEHKLVSHSDLVTAITPEDAAKFRAEAPGTPIDVLTPGYAGRKRETRHITDAVPRRAVLVGSFDWIAKQMNLADFLAVAEPVLAAQNIELQVVGGGNQAFLDGLRLKHPSVDIVGRVAETTSYFEGARIAVVPELSGGGFKLKVLDYIFNRTPIAALDGSIAGTPLVSGKSGLFHDSYVSLARGIADTIDNLELLNSLQNRAYEDCRDAFNWRERGERLRSSINALEGLRDDAAA